MGGTGRRGPAVTTLIIIGCLVTVWAAEGQPGEASDGQIEHDDPEGDTALTIGGNRGFPPGDIDAFKVARQDDAVLFDVQFVEWPGAANTQWIVWTGFTYGGIQHRIELQSQADDCSGATLFRKAGTEWQRVSCPSTTIDVVAGTLQVHVEHDQIQDRFGIPAPGADLDAVWVSTTVNRLGGYQELAWRDRAPDTGSIGPLSLPDVYASGPVRVSAVRSILPTNGEQSTFAFPLTIANTGSEARRLVLEADAFHDTWSVRVPPTVHVAADSSVNLTLIVAVPPQHDHGKLETFDLVVSDADNLEEMARKQLGLQWLSIPQPTQHHPHLFLHAADGGETQVQWFNAAPADSNAEDIDFQLKSNNIGGGVSWETGDFFMVPEIFQGLHFIANGTATLKLDLWVPEDMTGVRARLDLDHCEYATGRVSGDACDKEDGVQGFQTRPLTGRVEIGDLQGGQAHTIEASYAVQDLITVIPASLDARLIMKMWFSGTQATPAALVDEPARILQGSYQLTLPLLEYVEEVEGFVMAGGWHLSTDERSSRRANPGDFVVFEMDVVNRSNSTRSFETDTVGALGEAARILVDAHTLEPGQSSRVRIGTTVPDSVPGQVLDGLLLVGDSTSYEAASLRYSVLVVDPTVEDIPSDSLADHGGKRSSGVNALGIGMILALGGTLRRRSG